jgi:hypothetical protein
MDIKDSIYEQEKLKYSFWLFYSLIEIYYKESLKDALKNLVEVNGMIYIL